MLTSRELLNELWYINIMDSHVTIRVFPLAIRVILFFLIYFFVSIVY